MRSMRTGHGQRVPWSIRLSAWQFRGTRANYYEFLAQLLSNRVVEQTLLLTFEQDSWRHGTGSARGRLAAWWAKRYAQSGANLVDTWQHTLPDADLQSIGMAQQAGQDALVHTLQSLAQQIRLWQQCASHFWQTVAVGVVAIAVALACVIGLPLWTVPRLTAAFSSVPPEYYGGSLLALLAWAEAVNRFWPVGVVLLLVFSGVLFWSLSGMTGTFRDRLDGFGIWRLYRDLQAMRFLTGTATLLNALSPTGVSLRTVLTTQQQQANAWLDHHLQRMVRQLDAGVDALTSLNTGLLGGEVWWRFVDVVRVHGLALGLGTAATEIGQLVKAQLARRAMVLRWLLLISALGCVMAVGAWHLRAIEELRQAMALHYSLGS